MTSEASVTRSQRRKPSPKLAGTVHPLDDLTAPSTPESDWQLFCPLPYDDEPTENRDRRQ
ncbi:MAG: hypothetical protein ACP5D6_08245 [Kosmotogaceae bacterium]